MAEAEIQYVSNESGEPTAVIVPISVWRDHQPAAGYPYTRRSDIRVETDCTASSPKKS
jgi:hypothetical protein